MKSIRSYQMRSFEVMLTCVSNDQEEQKLARRGISTRKIPAHDAVSGT